MADKKISQLTEATTLGGDDIIPVVQGGVNKQAKRSLIGGSTIISGTTAPVAGTGANGDYYLDKNTKTLYGPKAAGAWPAGTVLGGDVVLKYNNTAGDLATDILQEADVNTGETVNYREVTTWHDGTAMTDAKCDGVIYRKKGTKYYALIPFLSKRPISTSELGIKGTEATDLSAVIQKVYDMGGVIDFGKGTFYFNVTLPYRTLITGQGSYETIIKPYNVSKAAFTSTAKTGSWSYHGTVANISIVGTGRTGIGFAMGKDNYSDYATNDEYANNYTFMNVKFEDLDKGFYAPFGAIGCQFHNCNYKNNKYGQYHLDNKFSGSGIMHAGNKYIYGGEFNMNDVAIYVHNAIDGFGAISITDTVFEANKCNIYINTTNSHVPLTVKGTWNEVNGYSWPFWGGANREITIDQWTGSTKNTQTITARSFIFDGSNYTAKFDHAAFGGVSILGTNINVIASDCQCEEDPGFGGGQCFVANPDSSKIVMIRPMTEGGVPSSIGCYVEDYMGFSSPKTGTSVYGKQARVLPRFNKVASYGEGASVDYATSINVGGSATLTPTVVNDGIIYATCCEYEVTTPDTDLKYYGRQGLATTIPGKYYVATVDMKMISGECVVYVRDGVGNDVIRGQYINAALDGGRWTTIAGLAKINSTGGLYLDLLSVWAQTLKWRWSAFQVRGFDTLQQAQAFLKSQTYVMP